MASIKISIQTMPQCSSDNEGRKKTLTSVRQHTNVICWLNLLLVLHANQGQRRDVTCMHANNLLGGGGVSSQETLFLSLANLGNWNHYKDFKKTGLKLCNLYWIKTVSSVMN